MLLKNVLKINVKHNQPNLKRIYITKLEKIKQDFKDKKVDFKTFYKKSNQIEIKIIKEKYRDELIECQLKNCYKETEHMVKNGY